MPFVKGKSGNPAGKPKGAKDHVPRTFRALARRVVETRGEDITRTFVRGINAKLELAHRYLAILATLERQQIEHDVPGLAGLAAQLAKKVVHEIHPGPTKDRDH